MQPCIFSCMDHDFHGKKSEVFTQKIILKFGDVCLPARFLKLSKPSKPNTDIETTVGKKMQKFMLQNICIDFFTWVICFLNVFEYLACFYKYLKGRKPVSIVKLKNRLLYSFKKNSCYERFA